jgi:hypothetical protein
MDGPLFVLYSWQIWCVLRYTPLASASEELGRLRRAQFERCDAQLQESKVPAKRKRLKNLPLWCVIERTPTIMRDHHRVRSLYVEMYRADEESLSFASLRLMGPITLWPIFRGCRSWQDFWRRRPSFASIMSGRMVQKEWCREDHTTS